MALVSVIIPCFNYGHFLEQALESVRRQKYKNFEVIIVDDGSTDNTKDVAEKFGAQDSRFRYMYQNNMGLSEARNTGIRHANGTFIQLLDADDLIEEDKLLKHVGYLEANSDRDIVFSDAYIFEKDWRQVTRFKINAAPVSEEYFDILYSLTIDNFYLPGCPVFRKSIVAEIGFFDRTLRALEDWHFWYRAALAGKRFHRLSEVNTRLLSRAHGFNMSSNQRLMWKNKIDARVKLIDLMESMSKTMPLDDQSRKKIFQRHAEHLALDKIRYHSWFGNVIEGVMATIPYGWYSGRPIFGMRESFYCLRQRLKALIRPKQPGK